MFILGYFLVVVLYTVSNVKESVSMKCGLSAASHVRIIGGDYAKPHQFPWMVHLISQHVPVNIPATGPYTTYTDNCGGALIDNQWVVTAAHCIHTTSEHAGYKINGTWVTLGAHNLLNQDELKIVLKMKKFHVHEQYNQTKSSYDIALVKLEESINFEHVGYKISPICLPQGGEAVSRTECQVVGWGNEATNRYGNGVLKSANVNVLDTQTCTNEWPNYVDQIEVCAGGKDHKTCLGDSGGPLQCRNDVGQWVLQGVISYGDSRCDSDVASVFTKVLSFVSWINKIRSEDV